MQALILSGGQGTRLRPLTDTRPKPLVPFMGTPLALGLLARLAASGVTRAAFLVGADATPYAPLGPAGARLGVAVEVVTEAQPLDTAGAARLVLRRQPERVLVCNVDILTDLDYSALMRTHEDRGAVATLALTRVSDTASFGVVVCEPGGRVRKFVEKPPAGTLEDDTVNAGTYVLQPEALTALPGDGPLSFERDVFPRLVAAGAVVVGQAHDGYWLDLGTARRYLDGHAAVVQGRCDWPVSADLRSVAPGVLAAADAVIDPSAHVGPDVVCGSGSLIEAGAVVRDAVLHAGARVGAGARVVSAVLGAGASAAPGARVGGDRLVADGAVVPA